MWWKSGNTTNTEGEPVTNYSYIQCSGIVPFVIFEVRTKQFTNENEFLEWYTAINHVLLTMYK